MEDHKFAIIVHSYAAKGKRSRANPNETGQDKLHAIPAAEQSDKCHRSCWGIIFVFYEHWMAKIETN